MTIRDTREARKPFAREERFDEDKGQCIKAFERLLLEARGHSLVAFRHSHSTKSSISTDIEVLHVRNKDQLHSQ